ncbi:hypothetical protein Q6314_27250, partial [Klebsiella pneumoniae]
LRLWGRHISVSGNNSISGQLIMNYMWKSYSLGRGLVNTIDTVLATFLSTLMYSVDDIFA